MARQSSAHCLTSSRHIASETVSHQSGSAGLLLVTALVLFASVGGYAWLGQDHASLEQKEQRLAEMQSAKERLFAFSTHIPDIYVGTATKLSPGFFLCPDMDALTSASAGSSNGSCSWATGNAIGRLPTHKTTANGQYVFFSARSASGTDSFWYLIHNALRLGSAGSTSFYYLDQNPVYDAMPNNLTLDGVPIVAAIVDAGKPLSFQTGRNRDLSAKQQWQEHLECIKTTSTGATLTQQTTANALCNDRIVAITKTEFDHEMKQAVCRLASEAGWCSHYDDLSASHWFKQVNWSHQGNVARICHLNASGKPDALNSAECHLP